MATERQIAANRANAQKSTGPSTPEGKAAVRLNALKHGIDAKSQIITGEDSAALEQLATDYFEEYQPATSTEAALVEMLVQNLWTMRRMIRIEAEGYESERERIHQPFFREVTTMGQVFVNYPYAFGRIGRRTEAAQRNFHLALKELQRLQAARREAASPPEPPRQPADSESPTTKLALIRTEPQSGALPDPRPLTPDPASAASLAPDPGREAAPANPRAAQPSHSKKRLIR